MKKYNENEPKPILSLQMLKNCKNKIAKFGYDMENYYKFLISVKAMKDKDVVLKYHVSEMEDYRSQYVRDCEYSTGDNFMFDKMSQIWTSDENGNKHKTQYFCPRSFWDGIMKEQYRASEERQITEEEHEQIRGLLKKYKPTHFDENSMSFDPVELRD